MKVNPKISVCISMYNAEAFVKECIDSILSQTFKDFEILIVDDGSTDKSLRIIESHKDARIRIIKNKHDYISSLNILLSEAKGKYIARMDADDIMLPERLSVQFKCMEENPNIDILAALIADYTLGDTSSEHTSRTILRRFEFSDFTCSNPIAHSTTFIRKSSLKDKGLQYSKKYIYAEDYALWCDCILANLKIYLVQIPVIKYRISDQQVTRKFSSHMKRAGERVQNEYNKELCKRFNDGHRNIYSWISKNKISAIIPFLNEGEEVINTIKSLREHLHDGIDIIIINDQSTDGYPYTTELSKYNVHYIVNWERKGVAASRDYGVQLCKTPYFILMDAHMRIYDSGWATDVCRKLDFCDRQILCMQTRQLWKNPDGNIVEVENAASVYGAYLTMKKSNFCPSIEWSHYKSNDSDENICAVLGAGYAASKRYWNKIKGLQGLKQYGCDEAYLSLKVWLEGGKCTLLKSHIFGHIYRDKAPYSVKPSNFAYNYLLIAYTLFPKNVWIWALVSCLMTNPYEVRNALSKFKAQKKELDTLKQYYESIRTLDFHTVWKMNQNIAFASHGKPMYSQDTLQTIFHTIIRPCTDNGIVSGNMARWIWASHYTKKYKLNDNRVYQFHEQIFQAIKKRTLPLNFKNGLLGIGWGLIYMYNENLIDEIDAEVFEIIDNEISNLNLKHICDYSLFYGLGGLYAYICNRIAYCCSKGTSIPWDKHFISDCEKVAYKMIKNGKEFSTLFYAFLFIEYIQAPKDLSWYRPFLSDWISVNKVLPKNSKYWSHDLYSGCLSQTICLLKYEPITLY